MTSTTYTPEMAHAAAQRGARWLDKRCPNWFREIDLARLDLRSGTACVLGQTAQCLLPEDDRPADADFEFVMDHYAPWAGSRWARRLGFEIPTVGGMAFDDVYRERERETWWEMLTIAWREIIRERLAAESVVA